MTRMIWQISLPILGLAIFLLGMRLMSGAMQKVAGGKLQSLLTALTKTPLRGTVVGTVITAVIQSSSATTVMIVAAVDGGLLNLKQALSLIAGANVGTTITAQIASLELYSLIVPLMFLGAALFLLPLTRPWTKVTWGLALLFLGLKLMGDNLAPWLEHPYVRNLLLSCSRSPFLGIVVGVVVTAMVQSSSAVTGVVIGMAASHSIDLSAAMSIALGSNVGTCITALIATWGSGQKAKQAAYAHLWFNIIGVVLVMPFYVDFLGFVAQTGPDVVRQVANGHTLFNGLSAIVFLLFISPLAHSLEAITR